jgi:dipeptide/tripeptide permease
MGIYAAGLAVISLSAMPFMFSDFPHGPTTSTLALFLVGVALLSVGYGGVKTCSVPLLGETIEHHARGSEGRTVSADLTRGFLMYSTVVNVGGFVGLSVAPMLRAITGPTKEGLTEGEHIHTGYYASYLMCLGCTLSAIVVLLALRSRLACIGCECGYGHQEPLRLMSMTARRLCHRVTHRQHDVDASEPLSGTVLYDEADQTLHVCKLLLVLPLYWLILSQFMINAVVQAEWLDMPAELPPEVFNNVNTFTALLTLPALGVVAKRRPLPHHVLMTIGFGLCAVAICACALLQYLIQSRGTFHGDTYVLNAGERAPSAALLLIPYSLSGVASAFVGPTVLEAAYTMAPTKARSVIMAAYLLASSCSGFLGLAFAPLARPRFFMVMFVIMALLLVVGTAAWLRIAPRAALASTSRANPGINSEDCVGAGETPPMEDPTQVMCNEL